MPKALLEMSRAQMRATFATVMAKRIYTLNFDRSTTITPALRHSLEAARDARGVVVSTPTTIKSVMLAYVEVLQHIRDARGGKLSAAASFSAEADASRDAVAAGGADAGKLASAAVAAAAAGEKKAQSASGAAAERGLAVEKTAASGNTAKLKELEMQATELAGVLALFRGGVMLLDEVRNTVACKDPRVTTMRVTVTHHA